MTPLLAKAAGGGRRDCPVHSVTARKQHFGQIPPVLAGGARYQCNFCQRAVPTPCDIVSAAEPPYLFVVIEVLEAVLLDQFVTLRGPQIFPHHLFHQFVKRRCRCPAELAARLGGIAE